MLLYLVIQYYKWSQNVLPIQMKQCSLSIMTEAKKKKKIQIYKSRSRISVNTLAPKYQSFYRTCENNFNGNLGLRVATPMWKKNNRLVTYQREVTMFYICWYEVHIREERNLLLKEKCHLINGNKSLHTCSLKTSEDPTVTCLYLDSK